MNTTESNIENGKEFIRNRITELRLQANVSEYQMSLELGQNRSYIQSISSGKALPSMSGFLNICDYFNITPVEFFSPSPIQSSLLKNINDKISQMSETDLTLLNSVLERVVSKN